MVPVPTKFNGDRLKYAKECSIGIQYPQLNNTLGGG